MGVQRKIQKTKNAPAAPPLHVLCHFFCWMLTVAAHAVQSCHPADTHFYWVHREGCNLFCFVFQERQAGDPSGIKRERDPLPRD